MNSVAIVTRLTAAFYLKRTGVLVTVYGAGGRAGGVNRKSLGLQPVTPGRFLLR